jgi:hypothetical protein
VRRCVVGGMLLAGGLSGVLGAAGTARSAPIPIPPVPAPPLSLPPLPDQLNPPVAIVSPALSYDCVVNATVAQVEGLGIPVVAGQVPEVSFQYLPTYVALTTLPCSLVNLRSFYECRSDQQLMAALQATENQLATTTGLPVGFVNILPLPLTSTAATAETIDTVAVDAGQVGLVESELSSLGCTPVSQLGTSPTLGGSTGPPASTGSVGAPQGTSPSLPLVNAALPTGAPPSGVVGAVFPAPASPEPALQRPTPNTEAATPALIHSRSVATGQAAGGAKPLAVGLLIGLVIVGVGLWTTAGRISTRETLEQRP